MWKYKGENWKELSASEKFHQGCLSDLRDSLKNTERIGCQIKVTEERIQQCRKVCDQKRSNLEKLNGQLSSLPEVLKSVDDIIRSLANICALAEEVEESLHDLEDTVEVQEMEKRILDAKVLFVLHRERRSGDLEQLKEKLKSEHAVKVREFESRQAQLLQEKQKEFERAFQKDVTEFVASGKLPETKPCQGRLRLEDVTLDEDPCSLETFLNDLSVEEAR